MEAMIVIDIARKDDHDCGQVLYQTSSRRRYVRVHGICKMRPER